MAGKQGHYRNAAVLNAGAALYVAGKAASIEEGVRQAEKLIDSGAARALLDKFIRLSNTYALEERAQFEESSR